jgi:hypothetical protein
MSDPFICYYLIDIGRRVRFSRDDFSKAIDNLAEDLMSLIDRARKDNASAQLVDNMVLIHNMLLKVEEVTSDMLEKLAKYIDDLLKSDICNLEKRDVCTGDEFAKLVSEVGYRRAVVECYKKNIIACRDVTIMFKNVKEGERVFEVIYHEPVYGINRVTVKYSKGREKVRGAFFPIVPAAYEKCLGIKVEVEGDSK